MDVDQAQQVVYRLRNQASDLQGIVAQLGGRIEALHWVGTDRDSFVGSWNDWSSSALASTLTSIESITRSVAQAVARQQSASST